LAANKDLKKELEVSKKKVWQFERIKKVMVNLLKEGKNLFS
jgi:hypothetical protein